MAKLSRKFNKEKAKKVVMFLIKKPFLTFLGIFAISLFLGFLVFYQYVLKTENEEVQVSDDSFKFDKNTFQEVLNEWQKRSEIETPKNISNPFEVD
jgi:uncharacterized membrane protein